ncbi:MAG: hypothetical protein Q8L79_08615 [Methylobacter sp.]|uniref:hypothetical protein n=1 Tax=Methylobacter sp. TaxID=2051955 RepID=UPI00273168A9|nr:hypothetical protein [Methylobacter sp.]MDP1665178.1 hypothetical protein [Methylobacter sp.]
MMELKRQGIVDVALRDGENVLEDYALVQLINSDQSPVMTIEDAKKYYASLDKAKWKSD